ncbi:MAG: acyl-CoA thioesterase [Phycisphaeraceae bacterium]
MSQVTLPLTDDAGRAIELDEPAAYLHPVRVLEHDVDGLGHANNAVYPRWMDEAAYAHSAAVGYDWARYQQIGAAFVVRRHEIDYLGMALPGDRLIAATWPTEMERVTAWRRYQIVRLSDGETLVRALTRWVWLDLERGRPRRIPAEVIEAFGCAGRAAR